MYTIFTLVYGANLSKISKKLNGALDGLDDVIKEDYCGSGDSTPYIGVEIQSFDVKTVEFQVIPNFEKLHAEYEPLKEGFLRRYKEDIKVTTEELEKSPDKNSQELKEALKIRDLMLKYEKEITDIVENPKLWMIYSTS